MFINEPGLQFIFLAMSGYGEQTNKTDLDAFFTMVDGPRDIIPTGFEAFSKESRILRN